VSTTKYDLYTYPGSDRSCIKCGASATTSRKLKRANRWLRRPECLRQSCYLCGAVWFAQTKDAE
jgi:hypothetical protein